MEPTGTALEEAMAHMEECAVDGRLRYQGSRLVSEKHFTLLTVEGATVKVPFLIAMKGREAVRECIQQQVLAVRGTQGKVDP
jgi:hypothetical protein